MACQGPTALPDGPGVLGKHVEGVPASKSPPPWEILCGSEGEGSREDLDP